MFALETYMRVKGGETCNWFSLILLKKLLKYHWRATIKNKKMNLCFDLKIPVLPDIPDDLISIFAILTTLSDYN